MNTQLTTNISENSFESYEAAQPPVPSVGTLTKAMEEACDEARHSYFERERVTKEYSSALEKATRHFREAGLAGFRA